MNYAIQIFLPSFLSPSNYGQKIPTPLPPDPINIKNEVNSRRQKVLAGLTMCQLDELYCVLFIYHMYAIWTVIVKSYLKSRNSPDVFFCKPAWKLGSCHINCHICRFIYRVNGSSLDENKKAVQSLLHLSPLRRSVFSGVRVSPPTGHKGSLYHDKWQGR